MRDLEREPQSNASDSMDSVNTRHSVDGRASPLPVSGGGRREGGVSPLSNKRETTPDKLVLTKDIAKDNSR